MTMKLNQEKTTDALLALNYLQHIQTRLTLKGIVETILLVDKETMTLQIFLDDKVSGLQIHRYLESLSRGIAKVTRKQIVPTRNYREKIEILIDTKNCFLNIF